MTDKIKSISQMIGSIFSAGIVLYGIFTFVEMGKDNNKAVTRIDKKIAKLDSSFIALRDTVILQVNRIETKQDKTIKAVQRNTGEFAALKTVVTTGFKKIMTADEVFEMFNTLEKGKSIQPDVEITIKRKQ